MRITIVLLLISVLSFFSSAFSLAAGDSSYMPDWNTVTSWKVRVVYHQFDSMDKNQDALPPETVFTYQVIPSIDQDNNPEIVLKAFSNDRLNNQVLVFSSTLNPESFMAKSISAHKRKAGTDVIYNESFDKIRPIVNQYTRASFDLPVFPLVPGKENRYDYLIPLSDMKLRKTIVQRVTEVDSIPGHSPPKAGKRYLKVACVDQDQALMFLQYWDRALPFPVYGKNVNMEYFLMGNNE